MTNPPAAAAGSSPDFAASVAGLSEPLARGLLLRLDSDLAAGGDRERLSNLEGRPGSFWSKRERFAVRRSVSSIVNICIMGQGMYAPLYAARK